MARREITNAAVIASQAKTGYANAQCIEATFGARVTASTIIITFDGPRDGLQVETSINNGETWDIITKNGQEIPGLAVGTPVIRVEVLTRVLFIDHADTTMLRSISTRVELDSGDIVERLEYGASLGTGSLTGCRYDAMRDGLVAIPDTSVEFSTAATVAYGRAAFAPHDANGKAQGIHISHGEGQTTRPARVVEQQLLDDSDRKDQAACTIECWIYPTQLNGDHHTILSWLDNTDGNNDTFGSALRLLPSGDGQSALVQFTAQQPLFLGVTAVFIQSTTKVLINQWSQIVLTYDGYRAQLAVNGVVVNTKALPVPLGIAGGRGTFSTTTSKDGLGIVIPTSGDFFLGRDADATPSGTTGQFYGRISEVRLSSGVSAGGVLYLKTRRRLTNEDIDDLVAHNGLREYWPLNEGTGSQVVGKVANTVLTFNNMGQANGTNWIPAFDLFIGRPYLAEETEDSVEIDYAPARISTPMVVQADTNVIRVTNAPFRITFPDGRVFEGVGQFSSIDTIQEPTEVGPTGITISLTALDASLVGVAMNALYLDGPLEIYQVYFDEDDQLVQDPVLVFGGLMDAINISASSEPTVVVSAESQLRNWQRSSIIKWNDEGHRALYPKDHGFEFVARVVDQVVWWPGKLTENI